MTELNYFTEASNDENWVNCHIKEEIDALESNNTLTIVPLPKGKHAIGACLSGSFMLTIIQTGLLNGIKLDFFLQKGTIKMKD